MLKTYIFKILDVLKNFEIFSILRTMDNKIIYISLNQNRIYELVINKIQFYYKFFIKKFPTVTLSLHYKLFTLQYNVLQNYVNFTKISKSI